MIGKTILEPKLPTTQSVEAVKTLITTINHVHVPEAPKNSSSAKAEGEDGGDLK
ncbi:MAG: hypothetical protein WB392_10310 [Methanotrichaceae archaeon]